MSAHKKETQQTASKQDQPKHLQFNTSLFDKENYKWMLIGLAVLALGFFLMAGGRSADPNVFNDKDVYSPVRITIAPLLIIAGFVIEIYAIMKKKKDA